ncbi:RBP11-like subunits of RNA polymerase [Sistotremastrum niveocremeum HHB9708]|uniref:RBP11-like subunits of RNA polymerase n=2 Tax=Sistotremastraceae TaxID=3402574 RepID=A0A164V8B5_9AGAM|nr:RBP11-like subunits of RNA polymerase [Sistotremastrum niveocremeum HHB9708]KZT42406.1 RBP11-like subunits of RNA polymerase [Sistotremastrum suecicum HHB10207 ss-3]
MATDQAKLPKLSILPGAEPNLASASYCIRNESHTLGNAVRWMLMKNPSVEFCGYSVPHPSEPVIHIRIQMYDQKSSLDALLTALDDLDTLFETINDKYNSSLQSDSFERWEEQS